MVLKRYEIWVAYRDDMDHLNPHLTVAPTYFTKRKAIARMVDSNRWAELLNKMHNRRAPYYFYVIDRKTGKEV